ncbi:hypothetical protein [Deinococcus marmoris]|uniref:Uncharacterized protein n=1 Tax=Deinococcus marmoris TaxID=249408 RepID=A0A1U7NU76_9DEIO|nr:hypothetical protein [Deinococcus marmoris]OLV16472.1 hypothetical protein BOO71_0011872 [Deinococcus marmoris]
MNQQDRPAETSQGLQHISQDDIEDGVRLAKCGQILRHALEQEKGSVEGRRSWLPGSVGVRVAPRVLGSLVSVFWKVSVDRRAESAGTGVALTV